MSNKPSRLSTTKSFAELLTDFIRDVAKTSGINDSVAERLGSPILQGMANNSKAFNPASAATNSSLAELTSVVTRLQEFVSKGVGSFIKSGLDVVATNPPSNTVIISNGIGFINGVQIENKYDIPVVIQLNKSSVQYVMMDASGLVRVSSVINEEYLVLCRIEAQGTSVIGIQDDFDPDGIYGYIVSAKDPFFFNDGFYDDDTQAFLKNALSEILAENVFGTLNLSESLKIANTQGTLEMDSREIRIKSTNLRNLVKLNANGTFFYKEDGTEFAHYGRNDARIGNIRITNNSVESVNFSPGNLGFQIRAEGDAEFNDITVRGTIYASAGEIAGWTIFNDRLSKNDAELNSNGYLLLGTGSNIARMDASDTTYRLWIGDALGSAAPFSVNKFGAIKSTSGTIASWNIDSAKLYSNNIELQSSGVISVGTLDNVVKLSSVDPIYRIWAGSATAATAPFSVEQTGAIKSTLGTIGSWTISSDKLSSNDAELQSAGRLVLGTGNDIAILDAQHATHRLWIGNSDPLTSVFYVTKTGSLYSTLGYIGGWTIGADSLSGTNISINSNAGGSISVGDILLTGSTSKIDVGNQIDIIGTGDGQILVGSDIDINGNTRRITLSNTGEFVAGDTTLNSQGLTIAGTYSSVSIGTGNDILVLNNSDGIYLGNAVKANAPFQVNMQGGLTSTSGTIAGWTIASTSLRSPGDSIILDSANKAIDVANKIYIDGLNERIESKNFQSGIRGWRIDGAGDAEFGNCIIRGKIRTTVFVKDQVSATSGRLLVSNASTLKEDIDAVQTKIYITEAVFTTGNRLRLKTGLFADELMKVTGSGSDGGGDYINVTRDLDGGGSSAFEKGTAIVSVEDRVELVTTGSTNVPYIDVIVRTGDTTEQTKARLGNLDGIGGGVSGYGLWSENVFLTGSITATSGTIGGWLINGNTLESATQKIVLDANNERITVSTITIDGANNRIDIGSGIDLDGSAGGKIIVGSPTDVVLDGATGSITANKGTIAGWSISTSSLNSGGATPIISLITSPNPLIRITNGTATQVEIGKYDVANYGIKSGDAVLNSNGLTISGTTSSIALGTGNSIIKMNNSEGLYIGNAIQASAPFSVTMAGAMTATSGNIGGWSISANSLYSGTGETYVGLSSSGTWRIWAGSSVATSAEFRVDEAGNMFSSSATITGDVTCTTLTANQSGTIGGWTIAAGKMSAGNLELDAANTQIKAGTGTSIVYMSPSGLWAGDSSISNAPFSVTPGGYLTATSGFLGNASASQGWQITASSILQVGTGSINVPGVDSEIILRETGLNFYQITAGPTYNLISYITPNGYGQLGNGLDFMQWSGSGLSFSSGHTISASTNRISAGSNGWITSGTWVFYSGNADETLAPFRVQNNGYLYATAGITVGNITGSGTLDITGTSTLRSTTYIGGSSSTYLLATVSGAAYLGSATTFYTGETTGDAIRINNTEIAAYNSSSKTWSVDRSTGNVAGNQFDYNTGFVDDLTNTGRLLRVTATTRAAIQSAIDTLEATNGGTVFIPAGTYDFSSSCTVQGSNISIEGEGIGKTILRPSVTGLSQLFMVGNTSNDYVNIRFRNITFDLLNGASNANAAVEFYVSSSYRIKNITFEDCEILEVGSRGLILFNVEDCTVKNNRITLQAVAQATGVLISGANTECTVKENKIIGTSVNGYGIKQNQDTGYPGIPVWTVIEKNRISGCDYGIYGSANLIDGNYVSGCDYGIYSTGTSRVVSNDVSDWYTNGINMSHSGYVLVNQVHDRNSSSTINATAIQLSPSGEVTCTGNTIKTINNTSRVTGIGAASGRVIIEQNHIYDLNGSDTESVIGIDLGNGCDNAIIKANRIHDLVATVNNAASLVKGISAAQTAASSYGGHVISGNIIRDFVIGGSTANAYGIFLDDITRCTISDNNIFTYQTGVGYGKPYGIYANGTSDHLAVNGNIVWVQSTDANADAFYLNYTNGTATGNYANGSNNRGTVNASITDSANVPAF